MNDLIIEETVDALTQRMAAHLVAIVQETLVGHDRFCWALSGGDTPRGLYETLASPPFAAAIDWSRMWIFWGDERPVPPEHKDSNYRLAEETLLSRVRIPPIQIFRMRGELPPAEAAADYQQQLQDVFGARALPRFDLIHLGLGPDGHTASLFPGTPGLAVKDRWVIANRVNALNTTRITLTLPVLNAARRVWFLAAGAKKAEAFARVRYTPDSQYPASLVHPAGELRWYVDQAVVQGA